MRSWKPQGFTLIELLIVIGICGMLVQLMLPAIQSAREAARKTTCKNNLRNLGVAAQLHLDNHKHYPSNGWGFAWLGDPDRGYGKRQPGSWVYNVLDYTEQGNLRKMGHGLAGRERADAIVQLCGSPIQGFNCPSRRENECRQVSQRNVKTNDEFKIRITSSARSDYAICCGSTEIDQAKRNPKNLEQADDPKYKWFDGMTFDGVGFGRSEVRFAQITDGTSKTYLIGEKFIDPNMYFSGRDQGDNESVYSGFDNDNTRSTFYVPEADKKIKPTQRRPFGSAHTNVWMMLYCDGSVHDISYELEHEVHKSLGSRNDGKPLSRPE
jgi:prepilin-type N-terminal cleavage/methylation domain-containing protein